MKIVFLDRKTIGEDIDLTPFEEFGEVVIYDYSKEEEVAERAADADVLVLNKVLVNEKTIGSAQKLELVCVTATGVNNLDIPYLEKRNIQWRNVAGYSTQTVAQHTFAMLFYLYEHLAYYDHYVKSGDYTNDFMFTHFERHFHEIAGKKWGIVGLGAIGRRVAEIASSFGAEVFYYSTSGVHHDDRIPEVSFERLLQDSDIISVHAPLNERTENLMNREAFQMMKSTAVFLNLGRGPIVDEAALADALKNGEIAAAGLDVLCKEPMSADNPLLSIKDSSRLIITPHIAWAGVEARHRLMDMIRQQIREFIINH